MSGPADNTPGCPVCGLAWQVRGCTPETCRGGAGFAVVHGPIRDNRFVANPGDFFNGHPLSSFCETCRLGILEIGRTERSSVTICLACTAMMMQPAPAVAPKGPALNDNAVEHEPPLCASCAARREQSKREGKLGFAFCHACSDARAAREAGGPKTAVAHPLPWRWERWEVSDDLESPSYVWNLRDARDGLLLVVPDDTVGHSPCVRAVTERAGAMEDLLRKLEWSGTPNSEHAFAFQLYECPVCNAPANWAASMHPAGTPVPSYIRKHRPGCELGTMLAEIDAAKARG